MNTQTVPLKAESQLHDSWLLRIGMPLVIFLIPLLTHAMPAQPTVGQVLLSYLLSAFITVSIWGGNRQILLQLRKRYPKIQQSLQRISLLFLLEGVFTVLGLALILFVWYQLVLKQPFNSKIYISDIGFGLLMATALTALYEAIYYFKLLKQQELDPVQTANDIVAEVATEPYRERFLVRSGLKFIPIEEKDIAYFFTENKIVYLLDKEGNKYNLDHSLDALGEMLDPRNFFRANRQYLVRIDAVKRLSSYGKSKLKLELVPVAEDKIIISQEKSSSLKSWLER